MDYVPATATSTEGLIVVFDGGTITDPSVPRLPADELSDTAFVTPAELGRYLPELQARRAAAASEAHRSGHAVYLEDGYAV